MEYLWREFLYRLFIAKLIVEYYRIKDSEDFPYSLFLIP